MLTRKLGAGGMGEVWMGQRSAMGGAAKSVAVKTLLADRASDEASRHMFLQEARLSMLLNNSNIVQVFDVDQAEDGTCYMAMEWVHGMNLSELSAKLEAESETLPIGIVAFIVGEILKALAYAHTLDVKGQRKTVVHRDVSPHNVMLSVSGEVKLMDFGIARLASEETSGQHVKGKLRYMPPEQLLGDTRAPTLDLFAVGAILHELLAGEKFRGGVVDESRLYGMILKGEVPPLSCADELPSELVHLRNGLLAAKVEDRIPSAREAYRQLARWSGYRDAKFELEDLVKRFMKAEPEITATLVLPTDASDSASAASATDRSKTDVSREGASEQTGPRSSHDAQTEVEPRPAAPPASRRSSIPLSIGLAAVGLGFGVFGAGAMLGWWSDEEPEAQAEQQADLPAGPPTPTPEPEHEPSAEVPPEPRPGTGESGRAEQAAGTGGEEEEKNTPPLEVEPATAEDKEPTKTNKRPKITRTAVTLVAPRNKFWFAIKVAGKEFTFDRKGQKKTSKLKPGTYSVSYRESVTGAWHSAGKVTIPRAAKATLEVSSSGKASVK